MMTRTLTTLSLSLVALAAVLLPQTAEARDHHRRGGEIRVSSVPPRPVMRGEGNYELVTTQVWVPGESERVWVETCRSRGRSHRSARHCDGHWETRRSEGYFEERHEWVWVPAPTRPRVVVSVPTPLGLDIRLSL